MTPTPTERGAAAGALDDWRRRRLIAAGFDDRLASELADGAVDLHELLVLVERGCPHHLAARILAPLDRPAP